MVGMGLWRRRWVAGAFAAVQACALSAELAASSPRRATILGWVMVLAVSFGVTGLVVDLVDRLSSRRLPKLILICTLAAGCGVAAIVMPAGFPGFAISEHSPNCLLNSAPLPLLLHFSAGVLLLFAAIPSSRGMARLSSGSRWSAFGPELSLWAGLTSVAIGTDEGSIGLNM
ncbi:hypothetical protein GCM10009806_03510 [Microbacterium flavum]